MFQMFLIIILGNVCLYSICWYSKRKRRKMYYQYGWNYDEIDKFVKEKIRKEKKKNVKSID